MLFKKCLISLCSVLVIFSITNVYADASSAPDFMISKIQSYYLGYVAKNATVYGKNVNQNFSVDMPVKGGSKDFVVYFPVKRNKDAVLPEEVKLYFGNNNIKEVSDVDSDCVVKGSKQNKHFACWAKKNILNENEFPQYSDFFIETLDEEDDLIVAFDGKVPDLNFELKRSSKGGKYDQLVIKNNESTEVKISSVEDGKYLEIGNKPTSEKVISAGGIFTLEIKLKTDLPDGLCLYASEDASVIEDTIEFEYVTGYKTRTSAVVKFKGEVVIALDNISSQIEGQYDIGYEDGLFGASSVKKGKKAASGRRTT